MCNEESGEFCFSFETAVVVYGDIKYLHKYGEWPAGEKPGWFDVVLEKAFPSALRVGANQIIIRATELVCDAFARKIGLVVFVKNKESGDESDL